MPRRNIGSGGRGKRFFLVIEKEWEGRYPMMEFFIVGFMAAIIFIDALILKWFLGLFE